MYLPRDSDLLEHCMSSFLAPASRFYQVEWKTDQYFNLNPADRQTNQKHNLLHGGNSFLLSKHLAADFEVHWRRTSSAGLFSSSAVVIFILSQGYFIHNQNWSASIDVDHANCCLEGYIVILRYVSFEKRIADTVGFLLRTMSLTFPVQRKQSDKTFSAVICYVPMYTHLKVNR